MKIYVFFTGHLTKGENVWNRTVIQKILQIWVFNFPSNDQLLIHLAITISIFDFYSPYVGKSNFDGHSEWMFLNERWFKSNLTQT